MADLAPALTVLFEHEGGFVNDANDPGGATKYGWSLRTLKRLGVLNPDVLAAVDYNDDGEIGVKDVRHMGRDEAAALYKRFFWQGNRYGQIGSQRVATKVFDLAVNMNSRQANKCLQLALRSCGGHLADDGIVGPHTLTVANACNPESTLAALRSEAAGYYRQIAAAHAALRKCGQDVADFSIYLTGWLNRAYA